MRGERSEVRGQRGLTLSFLTPITSHLLMINLAIWTALVAGLLAAGAPGLGAVERSDVIRDGATVYLEYVLRADGVVVDTTTERGPFRYVHGKGQIIRGLERQVAGLRVGEARQITVSPEEAYGALDPNGYVEVSKGQLPPGVTPRVGMRLRGVSLDGRAVDATVHALSSDATITLDLNHPLAGKTLVFTLHVVGISAAE